MTKQLNFSPATRVNKTGHILIYKPDHPSAYTSENWKGYVYEHRYVAEKYLGRPLTSEEVIHHLDGNPANNKWKNLLVTTKEMHGKLHEWLRAGAPHPEKVGMNGVNSEKANPSELRCMVCGLILMHKQRKCCSEECKNTLLWSSSKRPDPMALMEDLQSLSWVAIGRKYGVSDNCIRNWVKTFIKEGKLTLSQVGGKLPKGATTT